MSSLIRSELRKLATVRSTWAFVVATVLLSALFVASGVLFSAPRSAADIRDAFANASGASVVVLVLGIVGITSEYAHGTISTTLLAAPRRTPVLLAKTVTHFLAGAAAGLIGVVVATAILVPWLATHPAQAPSSGRLVTVGLAELANGALFGALGVGLGALLRGQALAIVTAVVGLFVVEPALSAISPAVDRYGPSAASAALSGRDFPHLPPQGVGGLLLLGYAMIAVGLGVIAFERREVS